MTAELFHAIVFYVFGGLALLGGVVMVAQRNPTYSAFAFILTLVSLSAVFALLGSPFIAVLQVIVYAGAIMVLFLFVLMLLNVKEEAREQGEGWTFRLVALGLTALLVAQVGSVLVASSPRVAGAFDASAVQVALRLFSYEYLYVFEATSILILAALVGAVVLARQDAAP
ncbi:MAG TPA: NADH-quinone oxidoreductase subunit J [Vicinamibacteria bacterium]|nr:NADH-quinone oxidoreductase subunit J [Vicinamibacteria bacterium]